MFYLSGLVIVRVIFWQSFSVLLTVAENIDVGISTVSVVTFTFAGFFLSVFFWCNVGGGKLDAFFFFF